MHLNNRITWAIPEPDGPKYDRPAPARNIRKADTTCYEEDWDSKLREFRTRTGMDCCG